MPRFARVVAAIGTVIDTTSVRDGVTAFRDENYVYTRNAYGGWELTYRQDGVGKRTHDIWTTTTARGPRGSFIEDSI